MKTMKRILVLFLSVLLLAGLFACGEDAPATDTGADTKASTQIATGTAANTDASTDTGAATDTGAQYKEEKTLTLKYDDRYDLGEKAVEFLNQNPTSKVPYTEDLDAKVLKNPGAALKDRLIAVGVGTCDVLTESGILYHVTVEPAPLSVALILGQSNGEGSTADGDIPTEARKRSIVCEEGQIYSTYAWSTTGHASAVAGISSGSALTEKNAAKFVAKTLTENKSWSGASLEYPLNSLASGKKGKVGLDSGLAWKWHELTGEKIWVINCAAGSTEIARWVPGGDRYAACVALMGNVRQTLEAEINAGHYVFKHYSYYWLQGESDCNMDTATYASQFRKMNDALMENIKLGDSRPIEYVGNIMVRAFLRTGDAMDIRDNGPRTAQKQICESKSGNDAKVFMACIINDKWISNKGVANFWNEKYPDSKYPFTCRETTYTNPTKLEEVHNNVHYLQPGYNEIGIECATNAVAQMYK